jgi:hybrid polyketide synthase/nonribosomal peptide synthetase ACE1
MDGIGKVLTYSDMTNRIEAIGEALLSAGVVADSPVLVYQQPAADWTCSMLAIMRIRAIYVPLNLREPVVRLSAVARDCAPKAVLADSTTIDEAPLLEAAGAHIINVWLQII